MKGFLLSALVALSAFCFATQDDLLSRDDVSAVFKRADKVMRSVLKLPAGGTAFVSGKQAASREAIVLQFNAMLTSARPRLRLTPPPVPVDAALVTIKEPAARALTLKLVKMGFIDKYGPLARGTAAGLSAEEFGEALGYFLSRLAEATHVPTTKFSPALTPPDDEG